jgi:hypothetical protein
MSIENPPAFPRPDTDHGSYGHGGHDGMTLRDYFAGQALGAIIVATSAGQHQPDRDGRDIVDGIAFDAYELADAMLTARQKGTADE